MYMLWKFQCIYLNGWGGVAIINFEFNWCSRLGAVTLKINKYCTNRYGKKHTHNISAQSVRWFMRNSGQNIWVQLAQPLGAVTQKIDKYCTNRYPKKHTHNISTQSIQQCWMSWVYKILVQSARPFRSSYTKTK